MRVALVGLVLLGTAGCASALREPPALEEIRVASESADALDRDDLDAAARASWSTRTLDGVGRAAELWTRLGAEAGGREAWISAVRARIWLADHEPTPAGREAAAASAVEAAQWCGRANPSAADCEYWLALGLGVQARERRATALDALPRMVELLERTIEREPGLDHAGPHRVLALVLLRAPGWPAGPGDPERGLEHARRAVEIDRDYPPNGLCLAEALAANGEEAASRGVYARAAERAAQWLRAGDPDALAWLEEAERKREVNGVHDDLAR